jgi:hypothetical protein
MAQAQNCYDCFHLKAKIPVDRDGTLLYKKATGYCKEEEVLVADANRNLKPRIFKSILRPQNHKMKTWKTHAERCPFFESMDD